MCPSRNVICELDICPSRNVICELDMCPSQNVICELDMNTVILKLFHWLIEQHAPQLMRVEVVVVYIVY